MSDSTSGPDLFNLLADEFAERYRQGERPPLSEYTDKYPELADQIHELFPALVAMEQFGTGDDKDTGPFAGRTDTAHPLPERLGEYCIVREIARGGMGVVYEAVQETLGRHVALKVLPHDRMADPSQLERFKREARAAAMLHHTNIVPVFGVGEDEGLHFYAMQFIQGQGLDAVLREVKRLRGGTPTAAPSSSGHDSNLAASVAIGLVSGQFAELDASPAGTIAVRTSAPESPSTLPSAPASGPSSSSSSILGQSGSPYFRSVARIGVQAAEALDYAHHQKLLHRDIKPSNLLLDLQGTVWVTDFGLVKAEGTDALTHTGEIVGTLRYMAPERFQGHADGRSDVYALGLTLYEMLTLEPAFAADQRARLIGKILHEEPSKPRQLDPQIPRDLETVVLKAIAKDPSDRYRTATDLAEDLRLYLADRTILARRASAAERARRWCRRNPVVASLAGAVLTLLVAAVTTLSVANMRIARERNAKDGALTLATEQRRRAEANLAGAAQVVDRMLTRVADEKLANVPQMEGLRRELLEDAVQFYEAFLEQNRGDKSLQLETAKSQRRLSRLFYHLGHYQPSGDFSRQAIAGFERLLAEEPARVDVRFELAEALSWRGLSFSFVDDHSEKGNREAEECFRRSVELYDRLSVEFPQDPDYRLRRIEVMSRLARRLEFTPGRQSDAVTLMRQIVLLAERLAAEYPDRWEYRDQLGESYGYLGWFLHHTGKAQEALGEFQKSFEITDSAPGEAARKRARRARSLDDHERAGAWFKIQAGRLLLDLSRPGDAEPLLRQAIAMSGAGVADFPTFGGNHYNLAEAKAVLGQLLAENGRPDEGIRMYRQSLDSYERAVDLEQSRPNTCAQLLESCKALCKLLETTGRLAEAEDTLRRSIRNADRFEREVRDRGYWGWFNVAVGWRYRNRRKLSTLLRQRGATAEADELVQKSIDLYGQQLAMAERLLAKDPAEPANQRNLALEQNNLAWLLATDPEVKADPARAVELASKAVKLAPENASYQNTLGTALYRLGDWSRAIRAFHDSNELDARSALGFNAYFLAMAHLRGGEPATARLWFDVAGRWHRRTALADLELRRFRTEAVGVLGLSPEAEPNEQQSPDDDATLARLVLQADPTAAWARTWLGNSTTGIDHPAGQPAKAAMPNGPEAFAVP